jgi:outer membrane protein TolC
MTKQTGWLLLIFFLAPPFSQAQQKLISLATTVRRVVATDPGVLARQAESAAAQTETRRAEAKRLPRLDITTGTGVGKSVDDLANVLLTGLVPVAVTNPHTRSRLASLSLSRPYVVPGASLEDTLYDGGQTAAAIELARLTADKSRVGSKQAREDVAYQAALDYLRLARGQILQRDLEQYAQIAQLAAKALAAQAKVGKIAPTDALVGASKYEAVEAALSNDRDDLRLWSQLLRQLGGFPPDTAFDTRPLEAYLADFPLSPLPEQMEVSKTRAVRDAALDARMAAEQLRSARAARLPQVSFLAEYGFQFSNLLFTFRPGYNVGVEVTYPLFTGRRRSRQIALSQERLIAARLQARKTQEEQAATDEQMAEENRNVGRDLEAAKTSLAQASEVYRLARLKYDQGIESPVDLLKAAELWLKSRQQCLALAQSSLRLRWAVLRSQGQLVTTLEQGVLP